jgi:hypothetical protein
VFGAITLQSLAAPGGVYAATLLLVAIDALLFSLRWRAVAGIAVSEAARANPWMVRCTQLLAARFFLLDVMPLILLAGLPTFLAAFVAAAGLFVDRFGFYALAVQHTTEYEVAAVEMQIAALDPPAQR